MTVFVPESIKVLGSDAGGNSVVLCDMFVDDLADLPAQGAYTGYKLSMGCTATVINDNSRHRINSAGQWVQIAAGTATYTKAEIDSMIARIEATVLNKQDVLLYIDRTNTITYSFSGLINIPDSKHFKYGILIGGGAEKNPEKVMVWLVFINTDETVFFNKITGDGALTLTGSISDGVLTITSSATIYGGLRLLWLG